MPLEKNRQATKMIILKSQNLLIQQVSGSCTLINLEQELLMILEAKYPTLAQKLFFEQKLGLEPVSLVSGATDCFSLVKKTWQKELKKFNKLVSFTAVGVQAFSWSDLLHYCLNPGEFSLKLRKDCGKHLLYGYEHAEIRRKFINNLPFEIRWAILSRKMVHFDLLNKIKTIIKFEGGLVADASQAVAGRDEMVIQDLVDIGMGHSVYLLKLKLGSQLRQFVIKQEELPTQSFFCDVLRLLQWPSFRSWHFVDAQGKWEISEYLGNQSLRTFLLKGKNTVALITQLAEQAALGDVFGRGDRHYENYLVQHGCLLPIDVSFLFWPDNEHWVAKYAAGGMCEFNYLEYLALNTSKRQQYLQIFFESYRAALVYLKTRQADLEGLIGQFFGWQDSDTQRKIDFIRQRLTDPEAYFRAQKQLYLASVAETQKRRLYKNKLQQLVQKTPELLQGADLLKMYYLADKQRFSNFFLLEDQSENIYQQIENLAPNK